MPRRNPIAGMHPDLFPVKHQYPGGVVPEERRTGGEHLETPMFVPLEDLTQEQLVELPRSAFSNEEWEQLDEDAQDEIFENDLEAQKRVDELASVFIRAYKYAVDPESYNDYSYMEDSFEQFLSDTDRYKLFYRGNSRLDDELEAYAQEQGLSKEEYQEIVEEVMADNNNYSSTTGRGDVYTEEIVGNIYVEPSEWEDLIEGMYPDEIQRAIDKIDTETDGQIDLDRSHGGVDWFLKKTGTRSKYYEDQFETGEYIGMDADWDRIESSIRELIDERGKGETSDEYAQLAAKPPEARVVHRWPDGFYVQDLLAEELPDEGKTQGICVGRPDMGYDKAVRKGEIKIFSLRRPSGKPLFTIEVNLDDDGDITGIEQVKGKANRLPGFDLGKTGEAYPIKRDEVQRLYEFIEGPAMSSSGIAVDDIRDAKPAAAQVNKLYHQGDKWAVKLLTDLGIEAPQLPEPKENPRRRNEKGGIACGLHGESCTGFCKPYRRRRMR